MIIKKNTTNTKVFALGGLEEIGKNTYCIEQDNKIIIIDVGIKFSNDLGIDSIIANYNYLLQESKEILGIFITHGHEDHIGGLPFLFKQLKKYPPIYAPKIASILISKKFQEHRLIKTLKNQFKIFTYDQNTKVEFKDQFKLSFFPVNHSIPNAFGIGIETKNGLIITTGDYKLDWTPLGHNLDLKKMIDFGEQKVKLLMADSTNSLKEGSTQTELEIINNIEKVIFHQKNRIIITLFSSNIHRIRKIIFLAIKHKRKILIFGRSLERIIKIIIKLDNLSQENVLIKKVKGKSINFEKIENLIILCTGSQGEKNAILNRVANNINSSRLFRINKKDTIIFSSSPIPGNLYSVECLINKLIRKGAKVYTSTKKFPLHTSGHASKEDQKILFSIFKPEYFMPMHGNLRMMIEHAKTAIKVNVEPRNVFICSNGDQINFSNNYAYIEKRINTDPVYIDGNNISNLTNYIIKDRNILAKNGLVAIFLTIDTKLNKLITGPQIITIGFLYSNDENNFKKTIKKVAHSIINESLKSKRPTFKLLKNSLKQKLAPIIFKFKRRNPLIVPVVLNII